MRRAIMAFGVVVSLAFGPAAGASTKYEPSKTISHDGGQLVYKMNGKRIIKLAVTTPTGNGQWVVEWWTNHGRFALFVPEGTTFDLWKSELKPFGNAVKGFNDIAFGMLDDSDFYGSATVWRVAVTGSIKLVHKPIAPPPDCASPAECGG
jgi:hypothetical protein